MSKEAIIEIMNTAISCNGKKLSELTEIEKHAVMFLGNEFPAVLENGFAKYDKDATQVTLAPSYVFFNKQIAPFFNVGKLRANSFQVFIDETLPIYEVVTIKEALEGYENGELFVIEKPNANKYSHLPPLIKSEIDLSDAAKIKKGIVSILASLNTSLVPDKELGLSKAEIAIHRKIHSKPRYKEGLKEIARVLQVNVSNIINFAPKETTCLAGKLEYESLGSASSYLATYIYCCSLGVILKNEKVMD